MSWLNNLLGKQLPAESRVSAPAIHAGGTHSQKIDGPLLESLARLMQKNDLRAHSASPGTYLISISFLRTLLQPGLNKIEIDSEWYLKSYPDVASRIAAGELQSAKQHYINWGYFENRLPRFVEVKEAWYIDKYSDVSEAIKSGSLSSAQAHFERSGFREGRLPFEGFSI